MSGDGSNRSARDAWIDRVLGVRAPGGGGATPERLRSAMAGWRQAIAAVDGQIGGLQTLLRQAPDPDLNRIAEFGLNALTGSHKIKLQAALMEIDSGSDTPQLRRRTQGLARAFLDHVGVDPRIAACDANPFGRPVAMRSTLTPALQALVAALGDAAS